MVDKSSLAIKAVAARRMFEANGEGIVWAILDTGIQAAHPHFMMHDNLGNHFVSIAPKFCFK